jgi:hypothetical protein
MDSHHCSADLPGAGLRQFFLQEIYRLSAVRNEERNARPTHCFFAKEIARHAIWLMKERENGGEEILAVVFRLPSWNGKRRDRLRFSA